MRHLHYSQTWAYGHLLSMVTGANSRQNHIPARSAICCILLSSLIGDHLPITLLATCGPSQLCKLLCNQEPLWEGRIFPITLDVIWLPNRQREKSHSFDLRWYVCLFAIKMHGSAPGWHQTYIDGEGNYLIPFILFIWGRGVKYHLSPKAINE